MTRVWNSEFWLTWPYIYTILIIIFSEMKKIQNKIDQESDEIKKKEYYSSSEYKMMEKKKKKIGLARMKTKTVSFPEFLNFAEISPIKRKISSRNRWFSKLFLDNWSRWFDWSHLDTKNSILVYFPIGSQSCYGNDFHLSLLHSSKTTIKTSKFQFLPTHITPLNPSETL